MQNHDPCRPHLLAEVGDLCDAEASDTHSLPINPSNARLKLIFVDSD